MSPKDSAHGKLNLVRRGSYALKCVKKSKVVNNKTEWIHLQTEVWFNFVAVHSVHVWLIKYGL